jgi:hypothetical protein
VLYKSSIAAPTKPTSPAPTFAPPVAAAPELEELDGLVCDGRDVVLVAMVLLESVVDSAVEVATVELASVVVVASEVVVVGASVELVASVVESVVVAALETAEDCVTAESMVNSGVKLNCVGSASSTILSA